MKRHYNYLAPEERFWLKVDRASDVAPCWLWTGTLTQYGYGVLRVGQRRVKFAHRLSYEIHKGEIPEGLVIDHLCFNRGCVNPDHLRAVTQAVNAAHRQPRKPAVECARGHRWTPENTYEGADGRRHCRACNREAVARYTARRQAAKA